MAIVSSSPIGTCLSMTLALGRATSIDDVYTMGVDALLEALHASCASLSLFDAEGVLRFTAWRNLSESHRAALDGYAPWAPDAPDPQSVVVGDVRGDLSLYRYRAAFDAEGIAALAFIPLVTADRVVGALMLAYDSPHALSGEEQQTAELIAAQVAFALARNRTDDISRHSEERLRLALQDAAAGNQLKDEFLATLSHELRTPLNAILGWVSILERESALSSQAHHALTVVKRNARLQAQLIEDLLDVSRIIRGKLDIETQTLDVATLVDGALSGLLPTAALKQIAVTRNLPEDLPPITGDPSRLQQVLGNVLANAIKFTPEYGRVDVSCAVNGSRLLIEIRDTGIGIGPDLLPHIFDRFRQGDSRSTRTHGGLGLGLAIARHLLELHGGDIQAESRGVGRGTIVRITFPIVAGSGPIACGAPVDEEPAVDLVGLNVLIVDDHEDCRELLVRLLNDKGAMVLPCSSAQGALEALASKRFDLLVADIAMPELDGYDLIDRVRQLESGYGRLRAIAVTAYARREDRDHALSAGYNGYCAKPLNGADFGRVLAEVLRT